MRLGEKGRTDGTEMVWKWKRDDEVDEKEEKWATREYKGGGKEESMG